MADRNRITVNFRDNIIDDELYKYIMKKGEVIGVSNAIKQIIATYKDIEEQEGK